MKIILVILFFITVACAIPVEELALDSGPFVDVLTTSIEGQVEDQVEKVVREKRQWGGT